MEITVGTRRVEKQRKDNRWCSQHKGDLQKYNTAEKIHIKAQSIIRSYHLSLSKLKAVRYREQCKEPELHQNRINTVEVFITMKEA